MPTIIDKLYNGLSSYPNKWNTDIDQCAQYGERGYNQPAKGIIFANWNDVPKCVYEGLERRGYSLEWYNEWIINHETSKAYRTSPNSYSWQPYYWLTDNGEVIGGDMIEFESEWQDAYI